MGFSSSLALISLCLVGLSLSVAVKDAQVIVVGTGAAGMTAAGVLLEAGFTPANIRILEGRETYGGRIRTDTSLGFPWSLGPMWIDGVGRYSGDSFKGSSDEFDGCGWKGTPYSLPAGKLCQPVEAIAKNYGIDWKIQNDYSAYWDYDGTFLGYDQACQSTLYPLQQYPCPDTPNPDPVPAMIVNNWGTDTNKSSMHGYLDFEQPAIHQDEALSNGVKECDEDLNLWKTKRYENWQLQSYLTLDYGAETYQTSWADFDWDGWFNDRDATLTDSYQPVADALYARIVNAGINVTYNAKVTKVNTGSPAAVTFTKDGSEHTIKGDYVIMTPSFVQYKTNAITFEPALPSSFKTGLKHLEQGVLEKTMLTFNSSFWRNYEPKIKNTTGWLMFTSQTTGEFPEFNMFDTWADQNALLTWAGGDYARDLVMKSDAEVQSRLQEIINSMWPSAGAEAQIQKMVRSNWTHDEWTQGCYSFWGVDYNLYNDWNALLKVGTAYFGGEHTRRDHPACVEGAIWSGQDAANAVCKACGGCRSFVYHPDTLADYN